MKKYQVIGGQYEPVWYGETDNLRGAKMIAARHMEYWDNYQGWHKPRIYEAQDVEEGQMIRKPKEDAIPLLVWVPTAKYWRIGLCID